MGAESMGMSGGVCVWAWVGACVRGLDFYSPMKSVIYQSKESLAHTVLE